MNDMISKSKVMEQLEIQIAECLRKLKKVWLIEEDVVTICKKIDTLQEFYNNIKDMTPLQFTDSAEGYTKREIETAAKNNCLTTRLNLAYAEIESLRKQYNETLKTKPKQEWISCDDRLPETDGYYLVYGIEYEFCSPPLYLSGKEIPYYGMLQYSLKHKAWNTKAPIKVIHWQPLPEPPCGAEIKRGKENE